MPAHLPDFCEFGIVALETGAHLKGVGGEARSVVFDHQRFITGLDIQLHVSESPPPEWPEHPVLAAVRMVAVLDAADFLALDVVPIAFFMPLVKRLGVGQLEVRASPAAGHQLRISRSQITLIEEQRGL